MGPNVCSKMKFRTRVRAERGKKHTNTSIDSSHFRRPSTSGVRPTRIRPNHPLTSHLAIPPPPPLSNPIRQSESRVQKRSCCSSVARSTRSKIGELFLILVSDMLHVLFLVVVFLEIASIVLSLDVRNHRHHDFPAKHKGRENHSVQVRRERRAERLDSLSASHVPVDRLKERVIHDVTGTFVQVAVTLWQKQPDETRRTTTARQTGTTSGHRVSQSAQGH